jgi:hypothetical protein
MGPAREPSGYPIPQDFATEKHTRHKILALAILPKHAGAFVSPQTRETSLLIQHYHFLLI